MQHKTTKRHKKFTPKVLDAHHASKRPRMKSAVKTSTMRMPVHTVLKGQVLSSALEYSLPEEELLSRPQGLVHIQNSGSAQQRSNSGSIEGMLGHPPQPDGDWSFYIRITGCLRRYRALFTQSCRVSNLVVSKRAVAMFAPSYTMCIRRFGRRRNRQV